MVHYFIDFENVHEAGLKGIKDIKEPSVIHVVGSDKTPKFDFKVLSSAPFFNVLWHFDVADNGKKDSLDILLATNLGYSIRGYLHISPKNITPCSLNSLNFITFSPIDTKCQNVRGTPIYEDIIMH